MRPYIDDYRLNENRSRDSDKEGTRGRTARWLIGFTRMGGPVNLSNQEVFWSVELPVFVIVLGLTEIAVVLWSTGGAASSHSEGFGCHG